MKNFGAKNREFIGAERVSRRNQDGVEIFERETMRVVRPELCGGNDESPRNVASPKLVIDDAISRSKLFISKRRSELSEVDALLRSLVRQPVGAK